ncbi:MAG TPA: membrane protein insertion efficiency factor YidD [Pseudonocardiaceae bacterium]
MRSVPVEARVVFSPTCSEYAAQALQIHGARQGSWLTIKRLCRCQPRRRTVNDPVPPPSACSPGQ